MDFQELISQRYSVRSYKPDLVEDVKLVRILEAARVAPSACNLQPFRILVIPTKDRKEELLRIYHQKWFVQGPLVLCVLAVPSESWVRKDDGWNAAEVDASIAMTHLILAASKEKLGTCWIAAFNPIEAREVLQISSEMVPFAFTPLGYPADSSTQKKRRPLSDLVRYYR